MTTQPFIYDYDYDKKGYRYAGHRRTDPRIAAHVHTALGNARIVLNVGAGAGSYEPADRYVLAIEPSAVMRAQRPRHLAPALMGSAEKLPLDDKSVDASMAMVTLHHWADMEKGLLEMKRVTRQRVLIMTFDGDALHEFWNIDYFPEVVAMEKRRYPPIDWITEILGGHCEVQPIPIPLDCVDGFQEAFYGRPEAFLDKEVRKAQSAWGFLSEEQQEILVERLAADLRSGNWDKKFGHLRSQPYFTGALRLIIVDLIPRHP
jgi:SAM-dependent methyltransferase